jgi:hypothetical protein
LAQGEFFIWAKRRQDSTFHATLLLEIIGSSLERAPMHCPISDNPTPAQRPHRSNLHLDRLLVALLMVVAAILAIGSDALIFGNVFRQIQLKAVAPVLSLPVTLARRALRLLQLPSRAG